MSVRFHVAQTGLQLRVAEDDLELLIPPCLDLWDTEITEAYYHTHVMGFVCLVLIFCFCFVSGLKFPVIFLLPPDRDWVVQPLL